MQRERRRGGGKEVKAGVARERQVGRQREREREREIREGRLIDWLGRALRGGERTVRCGSGWSPAGGMMLHFVGSHRPGWSAGGD